MKLGHQQVEVYLKHLDCVSMQRLEATEHHDGLWQVKITMLDARTYHENFDYVTDAADRVIELRDWRLQIISDKLDDLMAALGALPEGVGEQVDAILYRQDP